MTGACKSASELNERGRCLGLMGINVRCLEAPERRVEP